MRHLRKEGIIRKHIHEHKSLYLIIVLIFTLGFIVGSVNSAFLGQDIKQESTNYILNFVESLKTKNIDNTLLFQEVMSSNLKPIIYIWIFGLIIIGIPAVFIYVGLYGYSMGFTITSVISSLGGGKGSVFLITSLIPQEVIFIPVIFFMALNAIIFSKIINNSIKSNMKSEIMNYTLLLIISSVLVFCVSLFQTYIGVHIVKSIMNII